MAPQKNVLITGAAGGLGSSAVSILTRRGWRVFATDIREPETRQSDSPDNYSFIPLDVTSEESVAKAFRLVSEKTDSLDAVLHMTGILRVGSLVEIPEDYLISSLDINLLGAYRVNKQFLPMLLRENGRIVILSSEVGTQTAAPFSGPYAISKHALEAYSDSLRRELALLGIRVIKIQPGPFRTRMTKSGEQLFKVATATSVHFKGALARGAAYLPRVYAGSREPEIVASSIVKALESSRPRIAYRVKQDRLRRFLDMLPERWADRLIQKALSR